MSGGRTTTGRDRVILRPWRRIMVFSEAIKFEHSVFALPFAVVSALMAMEMRQDWASLGWVVLAMVAMRTFGMGSNRVVDAKIDARNPRTSGRALPVGLLSHREMWVYMTISFAVYGFAVSQLEPLAWRLAAIPVLVMLAYPYLKRFTWLSHFGLGVVYLIVPPAAWIAVTGELPAGIIWMGVAAMMWVAGFDVLYATADLEVDRAQGLKSIPARFGIRSALVWGRALHAFSRRCDRGCRCTARCGTSVLRRSGGGGDLARIRKQPGVVYGPDKVERGVLYDERDNRRCVRRICIS